jgi:hypothetical protein
MAKFITIGYGDEGGYERTEPSVRDVAHAHDVNHFVQDLDCWSCRTC